MATNVKARTQGRRLLQLVTLNTVYAHFVEQQHRAIQQGKITKRIPRAKLQAYAKEYYDSVRADIRNCESVVDVRLITDSLIKDIGPTRMGFLHAAWKGSRHATIEALQ